MNPSVLLEKIIPQVDSVIIRNLQKWLDKDFLKGIIERLKKGFAGKPVSICRSGSKCSE